MRRVLPRVRDAFELGRGLSLVRHPCADPADRRDGIEQAARAGRDRRAHTCLDDPAYRLPVTGSTSPASVRGSAELGVEAVREPRRRHAPWLLDRAIAARQADGHQHPGTIEAVEAAVQELAAPHGRVVAVARCRRRSSPAPGPSRRARPGTQPGGRGGAGRRPAPVRGPPRALEGVAGREVVGVKVVGDHPGLDREQALEMLDPLAKRCQRLEVLEVADVVPDPGTAALGDAEGALELGAAGEQRRRLERQVDAPRDVAARAPQHAAAPAAAGATARSDRVVGAHVDRPVMDEEGRRSAEPLQRLLVAVGDRLVGDVRAVITSVAGRRPRAAGAGAASTAASRRAPATAARPRPRRAPSRRRRAITIGRSRPSSSSSSAAVSSTRRRAAAMPAAISANGLSSRCLRDRSAATASSAPRRTRGGSRRGPSRRRSLRRPASPPPARPHRRHRGARHRALRRRGAARGRRPGKRWAGRGSGGRADRRTRPGIRAHLEAGHRRQLAGRRGRRGRS